ncbi:Imm1 family immunity protein [Streptomyces sp. NPDC085900]|uniref:Imm1 family immunity protein n=1 Tax=Streptomyces sp. NPDC085900 TaxID=3365737 RepID=UPI0037CF0894
MILNAIVHGERVYAETPKEVADLIEEVMHNLSFEKADGPWVDPGEDAWFMWADKRLGESEWPDNHLQVAVNTSTGYGGLIWFVTGAAAERMDDEISNSIWISNNPTPPEFDPRVVADPGFPLFHDRRSTIPVSLVRLALEEFCRAGTGDRPNCLGWVRGEMNGTRLE